MDRGGIGEPAARGTRQRSRISAQEDISRWPNWTALCPTDPHIFLKTCAASRLQAHRLWGCSRPTPEQIYPRPLGTVDLFPQHA
jgi:hypothetical protein